ncbi:MAG: hypothetical protein ACLUD0_17715 [Eubacterium ramulus]
MADGKRLPYAFVGAAMIMQGARLPWFDEYPTGTGKPASDENAQDTDTDSEEKNTD